MAAPRDLGTLVVSAGKSWINRELAIQVNGAGSAVFSRYSFRLTFLSSGYEVYSVPDGEYDAEKYLHPDNNDYILVKTCQWDPNEDANPQLRIKGIALDIGFDDKGNLKVKMPILSKKLPDIVAVADYTTKVHGRSMKFLLEPVDARYKTVTQQSQNKEDKSQTGPYKGMKRTGSWGTTTGTNETSYEPDIRYLSFRQIPAAQSR